MQPIQKKHTLFLAVLIGVQTLLCAVIMFFLFWWAKDMAGLTSTALREEALRMTQDKLQRRVDHIFAHLKREEESFTYEMCKFVEFVAATLPQPNSQELRASLDMWMPHLAKTVDGHYISIILHEPATRQMTLYNSTGISDISDKYTAQSLESFLAQQPIWKRVQRGEADIYVFVTEKDIHTGIKKAIYHIIHTSFYGEEGYIWVNEVHDFQGGDRYAVRVIHPNLKETEGQFLSTADTDVKGKNPYLTELEGIRENGEVFHTYFFQNLSNGKIAEKASYAKLYKPFNWIIATGDPLEQIYLHADELANHNTQTLKKTLNHIQLGLLGVFIITVFIIILAAIVYRRGISVLFHKETRLDPLTSARNRKAAEEMLEHAFRKHKQSGSESLVMMLDIDNFKQINDTYGHDTGDTVLKGLVQAIHSNIRGTDRLARWGGEEFLLLLNGINSKSYAQVGENILSRIRQLKFNYSGVDFSITISMGSSPFLEKDTDHKQAVTRADQALYYSKNNGKNRHTAWIDMQ